MIPSSDAWDELADLTRLLETYDQDVEAAEYFGVQLMRASLERRRADLIDAILAQREVATEQFDVLLGGRVATDRGVDVRLVSEFLREIQDTVAAIATGITRGPRKVRVSRMARELVALRMSVALPGSLALRLVPSEASLALTHSDLFGENPSVIEASIERLIDVLGKSDSPEEMLSAVSVMGVGSATHLRKLTRLIADSSTDTRLAWRSPRSAVSATVPPERARIINAFLESVTESETQREFDGRLMGGSLLRRRFELELPDGNVLSGAVDEGALGALAHLFGMACTAVIIETTVSAAGGGSRQSRTLVGLQGIDA